MSMYIILSYVKFIPISISKVMNTTLARKTEIYHRLIPFSTFLLII